MVPDIRHSLSRLFYKVAIFDVAILIALIILSGIFSANSKRRLAEQLADSFRAPLLSGDNRQVVSDMARSVFKDFSGVIWEPRDKSLRFALPEDLGKPNPFSFHKTTIKVFFDENLSEEAGALYFFYNRWAALPLALIFWGLLVALSVIVGYYEQRRMLREYNLSLESKINESMAFMAVQVAHDIRSPLTALDAALENTLALPEKQRAVVRHSLNRIRDVANGLLERNRRQRSTASAVGADTGEPTETRLLSSLIDSIISEKRTQYSSKPGIEIDFKPTKESYSVFAVIQPVEFGRLLSNLVNNAAEALGDTGKVDVRLTEEGNNVLLSIADNGKGIPPEILAKLGKNGETHGKAGGSGLGLYHARTTAESWGGSLSIDSVLGKGTTVTLALPKAPAPSNFVTAIELVPGKPVIVLDDDQGIHSLWQNKFEPIGLKEHNIEVIYFSEPAGLRTWMKAEPAKAKTALCLFDYELSGYTETGLGLAEKLGLCPRTILVTGRSEEKQIMEACARLKVRSIPKSLLEFVTVKAGAPARAVLIDDDTIVHMNWEAAAEEAGIELKSFKSPSEFLANLEAFPNMTPIYIDSELGVDMKGEDVAATLKEKGYANLTLVTGYSPERFAHLPWLKVRGKESPWRA